MDHPAHLDEGFIIVKQAEVPVAEETVEVAKDEKDDKIASLEAKVASLEKQLAGEDEIPVEDTATKAIEADPQVAKAFHEMGERLAAAESGLAKAADERATREAAEVAQTLPLTGVTGDLVKQIQGSDIAEPVMGLLRELNTKLDTADMFKEVGTTTPEGEGADLDTLAKARVAAGKSPNMAQAINDVLTENPNLYTQGA